MEDLKYDLLKKRYELKTPILRNVAELPTDDPLETTMEYENVQEFKIPKNETFEIGIATFIVYLLSISCVYFTAYANCDKTGIFKNWGNSGAYNTCPEKFGIKSKDDSITMSYAFIFSNRYVSTILIATTYIMIAILLINQNFAVKDENDGRMIYVVGTFIMGFMLSALLLFGPTEHKYFHFFAAFLILLTGTVLSLGVSDLYEKTYSESIENPFFEGNTNDLRIISYILTVLLIILMFLGMMKIGMFSKFVSPDSMILDNSFATLEIFHWFTFAIFLFIFSTKPPLLVKNFCAISV